MLKQVNPWKGTLIALTIVVVWSGHLWYLFSTPWLTLTHPLSYVHLILQGWLTTGLFITAHDAMHGTVSRNPLINDTIGIISAWLFAAMNYERLRQNHIQHHLTPATKDDPDFHLSQSFLIWFFSFIWRYKTWSQILSMAILYNVFERVLSLEESRIWLFWVIPSLWGSLQLFYFGTYRPHRLPLTDDMKPHRARTLPGARRRDHLWAFISCYFFGYHWEHHHSPKTPWWGLWTLKHPVVKA